MVVLSDFPKERMELSIFLVTLSIKYKLKYNIGEALDWKLCTQQCTTASATSAVLVKIKTIINYPPQGNSQLCLKKNKRPRNVLKYNFYSEYYTSNADHKLCYKLHPS